MKRKYRVLFLGLSSNKEAFKLGMIRLGAPPETIDRMIEKAPVILKEGLTSKNSMLYAAAVQKAGGIAEVVEYEPSEGQETQPPDETKDLPGAQDAAPLDEPEDLPDSQDSEPFDDLEGLPDIQDFNLLEESENLSEIQDAAPLEEPEDLPNIQNFELPEEPENLPISIIPFKDFTMCPECGLKQQKSDVCVKCGFRLVKAHTEITLHSEAQL